MDDFDDGNPNGRLPIITADPAHGRVMLGGEFPTDFWMLHNDEWQAISPDGPDLTGRQSAAVTATPFVGDNLFVFGGYSICGSHAAHPPVVGCSDAWTFNGYAFTQVTTDAFGDGFSGAAAAYDPNSTDVIIFGGADAGGDTDNFGLWDGINFSAGPTPTPSARSGTSMAYDGTNVMLFSGTNGANDTWVWNGTSWDQRCDEVPPTDVCTSPPARSYYALGYDSDRQVVLLFGGLGASGPLNDTWQWNGVAWSEIDSGSADGPEAAAGIAMVYDGTLHRMFLMDSVSNWMFDGAHWQRVIPANPEQDGLEYDADYSVVAYDAKRQATLLFSDESWGTRGGQWFGGAQQSAAQTFHVDLVSLDVFSTATFTDLQVRWKGGGTGHDPATCAEVDGAALSIWNGLWQATNGGNSAPASSPAYFTWSAASDPATASLSSNQWKQHFSNGVVPALDFALAPAAPNGCGSSYGSVASDYVEARVSYTLP